MTDVEKIRLAEQRVDDLQRVLGSVQSGLHAVEQVSTAVERSRRPLKRLLVAVAVISIVAVVAAVVSRRRADLQSDADLGA